jgi:hypothetical protein
MRTSAVVLASSAAALLATLAATRPAHALGPVDLEIAAKVGYGSNDYGFGFGGRAGVSFFGLYGGLNLVDYLGKSTPVGLGCPSPCDTGSETIHALQFGGEVGYGIKISVLTIRPLVGFGDLAFSGAGQSASSFYVEPGGLLQLGFGHFIFGVDAGCLIATRAPVSEAFTVHGQVGARF